MRLDTRSLKRLECPIYSMKSQPASTLRDIADRAEVTTAAVSYVLNNVPGRRISQKKREEILRIAQDLHYMPHATARSLATGRSYTLATCFTGFLESTLHDPYAMGVIRGIIRQASEQEYALQLVAKENSTKIHSIDGWIGVMSPAPMPPQMVRDKPIIYLDPHESFGPYSYWANNTAAGELLATKVAPHFHKALCLYHKPPTLNPQSYVDRGKGFEHIFAKLHGSASVLIDDLDPEADEVESTAFLKRLLRLRENGVDLIVCVSDMLAHRVMTLLKQENVRIPDDLSLVGFDNTSHSEFAFPPIATVDLGMESLGREVTRCLIDLIEGRKLEFTPPVPRWIARPSCRLD